MKEIKDDTEKWKNIPCFWFEIITIVKMTTVPQRIYRFNAISIKILKTFFTEVQEAILKFIWNHKRLWSAKVILKKKNQARGGVKMAEE